MTQTKSNPEQPQLPDTELRLPRPPGVFRRWLAAHPVAVDWWIVGLYLFGCAVVLAAQGVGGLFIETLSEFDPAGAEDLHASLAYLRWPWVLVTVLSVVGPAVALRFRRRWPVQGAVFLVILAVLGQGSLMFPNTIALLFLIYAVPVYRSVAAGWFTFAIAVLAHGALFMLGGNTADGLIGPGGVNIAGSGSLADAVLISVLNALLLLTVLMIGINQGNRRRYVNALIDRAQQLARERAQQAELAAAGERARIAREMHDIVAHSLSVVVTLSEGAAVALDTQPAAAKHAMQRAAETGREALAEMRRLLGVLRDPEVEVEGSAMHAPQPGISELPELVKGFREAGLQVDFTGEGDAIGDTGHQLTVYRITQEALTNALRYAGVGARVDVHIAYLPDRSIITVTDSGPAYPPTDPHGGAITGSGLGIVGARQRAEVFGGTVDAGPYESGWRLTAEVPHTTQTGSDA